MRRDRKPPPPAPKTTPFGFTSHRSAPAIVEPSLPSMRDASPPVTRASTLRTEAGPGEHPTSRRFDREFGEAEEQVAAVERPVLGADQVVDRQACRSCRRRPGQRAHRAGSRRSRLLPPRGPPGLRPGRARRKAPSPVHCMPETVENPTAPPSARRESSAWPTDPTDGGVDARAVPDVAASAVVPTYTFVRIWDYNGGSSRTQPRSCWPRTATSP